MTHNELLAKINEISPADKYDAAWQSALRAVVELHKPIDSGCPCEPKESCPDFTCSHCLKDYPCPTIQAIEKELG